MLELMRLLREQVLPLPDHSPQVQELDALHREVKAKLELTGRARLHRLMDTAEMLREQQVEENFLAGFRLGWMLREELQEADVCPMPEKGENEYAQTQTVWGRDGAEEG